LNDIARAHHHPVDLRDHFPSRSDQPKLATMAVTSRAASVAVCMVLCALGPAACGGAQTRDENPSGSAGTGAAAQAPASTSGRTAKVNATRDVTPAAPRARRARAGRAHLTAQHRRQARRLAKRFRKQTAKAPRGVVADSGVIP
jgi:hypothetical protein